MRLLSVDIDVQECRTCSLILSFVDYVRVYVARCKLWLTAQRYTHDDRDQGWEYYGPISSSCNLRADFFLLAARLNIPDLCASLLPKGYSDTPLPVLHC